MMNRQMELFKDGGLKDEGGMIDEESGNEVPIGGTKKGVRDDIAANVSEGEFVMPADVVRYHGLDKMMEIRQSAKMGLKQMEAMGQMGNSDEATMPDDMPFGMADLIVVGAGDEPMEFADGGFVPSYAPGGTVQLTDNASKYEEDGSTPATSFKDLMGGAYAEVVMYINAAGDMLAVPYINGSPVYPVPDGYTLYDPSVTEPTDVQAEAVAAVANANAVIRDNDDRGRQQQPPPKPPIKWQEISTEEFMSEAGKMVGLGRTVMNVATMFMGPLAFLTKGLMVINDRSVAKEIAQRIKSGEFSAEQLETLTGISKKLEGGGILGGIIDAVGNFFGASKEDKAAAAKVESVIPTVDNPVAVKTEAEGSGFTPSQELLQALNVNVKIDDFGNSTFTNKVDITNIKSSLLASGIGGVPLTEQQRKEIANSNLTERDYNQISEAVAVSTKTPVEQVKKNFGFLDTKDFVREQGSMLTPIGPTAATAPSRTFRDMSPAAQAANAATRGISGTAYSNLPVESSVSSGVDPRAGAMQYSGPGSSVATGGGGTLAAQTQAAFAPATLPNLQESSRINTVSATQKEQPLAIQTPGIDPSGGNYAVTPQQVAYSTSASRGSEDPYDPRGIMPTSEQIALQPRRTITPITTQSNAAGMRQGSNVYVDPNSGYTGTGSSTATGAGTVVTSDDGGGKGGGDGSGSGAGSGAGSSAVVDTSTGTGTQDQTKMVFNDEDYTPTGEALNKQLTDLGLVNKTDDKFAQPVDFSQTKLGESYDTTASGSELSGLDLLAEENATKTSGSELSGLDLIAEENATIDPNAGLVANQFGEYGRPDAATIGAGKRATTTSSADELSGLDLIAEEEAAINPNAGLVANRFGEYGRTEAVPKSNSEETFSEAFAREKAAGNSVFDYKGSSYTTQTADEAASAAATATGSDTGTTVIAGKTFDVIDGIIPVEENSALDNGSFKGQGLTVEAVSSNNVTNKTDVAVAKDDQEAYAKLYGDPGAGNVWGVEPGTNVITKISEARIGVKADGTKIAAGDSGTNVIVSGTSSDSGSSSANGSGSASGSGSANGSGSASGSTVKTYSSLAEAANDGQHGKAVNIAGKGLQKVEFADTSYNTKMATVSATKTKKDNDGGGGGSSNSSSGGDGCCFIMLEARYGNGTMDEVVRRYRDEYMTDRNRRGYYKLAEVLVPLMRKSKVFKWVVTKTFADPLVSYGKYYYGQGKVGMLYSPVKTFWMKVFDVIGGKTEFIRENGEVV